jgi:hypothetical protein
MDGFFVTLARWVVGTGSGDRVRCVYSSGADMNQAPGLVALYLHGSSQVPIYGMGLGTHLCFLQEPKGSSAVRWLVKELVQGTTLFRVCQGACILRPHRVGIRGGRVRLFGAAPHREACHNVFCKRVWEFPPSEAHRGTVYRL